MAEALSATAHDLLVGLGIAVFAALFLYLLVRSNRALRRREEARRCGVRVERVGGDWLWPPRPRPASASFAEDHATRTRVGMDRRAA